VNVSDAVCKAPAAQGLGSDVPPAPSSTQPFRFVHAWALRVSCATPVSFRNVASQRRTQPAGSTRVNVGVPMVTCGASIFNVRVVFAPSIGVR
jgi:hypothetical protein